MFTYEIALSRLPFTVTGVLAHLATLSLTEPILGGVGVGGYAIELTWANEPSPTELALVVDAVTNYVEIGPSDELLEVESLAITSNATTTLVDVIDASTPPRAAGTYLVSMSCLVGMLATVANAGVRAVVTFTRTQGSDVVSRQYEHNWNLQQPQTFAMPIEFDCEQGAIIRVQLQVARIGSAATAQMAMARVTAKKIG